MQGMLRPGQPSHYPPHAAVPYAYVPVQVRASSGVGEETVPSARKIAERRLQLFFAVGAVVGILLGILLVPLAESWTSANVPATEPLAPRQAEIQSPRLLFVFCPPIVEARGGEAPTAGRFRSATPALAPAGEPGPVAAVVKRSRSKPSTDDAPASAANLLAAGL